MSIPDPPPADRARGPRDEARAADARIHSAGLVALVRALGEEGAGRFLQIVAAHAAAAPGPGAGDYTAERHLWADPFTVDELMAELLVRQDAGHRDRPAAAADSTVPPSD